VDFDGFGTLGSLVPLS